jgi:carbamoyltransferase
LTAYHNLTGIPSLINTSFNMHEEPIVCTPDDAIRAFLQGNLDYLAIGDFLVEHPSARR